MECEWQEGRDLVCLADCYSPRAWGSAQSRCSVNICSKKRNREWEGGGRMEKGRGVRKERAPPKWESTT